MSLILDALKKSEQERRRERGPDLQTIHQATPLGVPPKKMHWGWLVLVTVNVAAVGAWWLVQRGAPTVAAPSARVQPVVRAPAPSAGPVSAPPAAAPDAEVARPIQEPQFTRLEPSSPPHLAPDTPVEEFADLPADVRDSLPAMTFSFHVYSADARNRTIIINDRRLREGEEVGAGVVLEAITEDGVILAMDHRRVHINVLTGW